MLKMSSRSDLPFWKDTNRNELLLTARLLYRAPWPNVSISSLIYLDRIVLTRVSWRNHRGQIENRYQPCCQSTYASSWFLGLLVRVNFCQQFLVDGFAGLFQLHHAEHTVIQVLIELLWVTEST